MKSWYCKSGYIMTRSHDNITHLHNLQIAHRNVDEDLLSLYLENDSLPEEWSSTLTDQKSTTLRIETNVVPKPLPL